ncbi:universal stress protein [Nocardioides islandensis]|jgi:nucleotide-binding universal stress UspA family protein|uniref:Universal stress protein n=1 Tax=Nocardioides islandensis TaxID=433663 RepID=A0A930VK57_9ACTN|nr:universal stress protein [Nocardioides islandensis]MBF4765355.1 universal stress protein [Nocardioides islandensis]
MGRVVVGVHGTEASRRALQRAATIARERGWGLEVVTAWPEADEALIHDVPGHYNAARGRAMRWQADAVAALDPSLLPRLSTYLVNARPAEALVARSADADLLVVGTAASTDAPDLPGVSGTCCREARCPTDVVADPRASRRRDRGKAPRARSRQAPNRVTHDAP